MIRSIYSSFKWPILLMITFCFLLSSSCGITSRAVKYSSNESVAYSVDSICTVSTKITLNEYDRKFENLIIDQMSKSNNFKCIVRVDTILSQLGIDKGLVLNPNLSYLNTIFQKTGIRYFLLCELEQFEDGQSKNRSSLNCTISLRDMSIESNLFTINGVATGSYENAFLANWIMNKKANEQLINTSSQNELIYPMVEKSMKLFLNQFKKNKITE